MFSVLSGGLSIYNGCMLYVRKW